MAVSMALSIDEFSALMARHEWENKLLRILHQLMSEEEPRAVRAVFKDPPEEGYKWGGWSY